MSNSSPFYARGGLVAAPGTRTIISTGNTAQRPTNPANGEIRFNEDIGAFEFYYTANTTWANPAFQGIPSSPNFIALGANTLTANLVTVGNSVVTNTSVSVGNSTVNSAITQGIVTVGATVVNTSGFGIGNSTVSVIANSTAITLGGTTLNTTAIQVGGGATINATNFSGISASSNNASFLGGVAAASYATTASLSAYQTTSGLATAVSGLTANNTAYLGGVAASNFWQSSGAGALSYLSQLNNNVGYITSASIPTNISSFNNNVGYITGLNSSAGYTVSVLVAGNYLQAGSYVYSSGNVYAVGDVYCSYSDAKLKKIKKKVTGALSKVSKLHGYYYVRNEVASDLIPNDGKLRVGLLAQDVQTVIPEAVSYIRDAEGNDTEYLTINHDTLTPFFVESIKELMAEIKFLKDEIKELRGH